MRHSLWQISKLATDEARYLHHDWVGSDHLLIAVMHPECPGAARKVLASFDVNLQEARNALVESLGDVFEESPHGWVTMPPATQLIFERATLKAFELRDENVTSQHVLLALIDDWSKSGTPACLAHVDCGADALRQRVIAMTEEMGDDQEPPSPPEPPPTAEPQMPRSPEPDLAMTPSGHDPRRRRPWGSAVFHDAEGRPLQQGTALRQYFIDRDGNPVLTADGRPVHLMIDDDGRYVLDEAGQPIVVPVDIPPGSTTKRTARQ